MYSEEKSKLISDLYGAKDANEAYDILEYIGEWGDSIFVYPVLDGYRKFKHSSVGYYFIWILSRLDYAGLGMRLNELLENYDIQREHIPMALFFMAERGYFSDIGDRMARMYLDYSEDPEFRSDFNLNGLGMGCVMHYLDKEDLLARYEDKMHDLLFNKDTNQAEKSVVLNYLLEFNQDKQMDFFIENYPDKIRRTDLEKNIAKKLVFCKADNAKHLRDLILEGGSSESVSILEKLGKKVGTFRGTSPETVVYSMTDAIIKISILRSQINSKTLESKDFGFRLFPENELMPHQSQSVDDEEVFFDLCKDLLTIIREIDPAVRTHGFSKKEAREIWVSIAERKEEMLLPQLLLFLNSRKVGVDYNFFGFRQLDRALESIVERKEDDEFFKKMRRLGVEHMYKEKKWHNIHSFFLNYYLQILDSMNKELSHLASRN